MNNTDNTNNNFWTNVFNQIHSFWQAIGVFIVGAVITYLTNTVSNEWTWQGLIVAALGAFATYGFTKDDHAKTVKAVEKAAATGDNPKDSIPAQADQGQTTNPVQVAEVIVSSPEGDNKE